VLKHARGFFDSWQGDPGESFAGPAKKKLAGTNFIDLLNPGV
jgi:hypothetical protein